MRRKSHASPARVFQNVPITPPHPRLYRGYLLLRRACGWVGFRLWSHCFERRLDSGWDQSGQRHTWTSPWWAVPSHIDIRQNDWQASLHWMDHEFKDWSIWSWPGSRQSPRRCCPCSWRHQGRNAKSLLGGCSKEGHLASYIAHLLKSLATKVKQFRALTLARCFFDLKVSFAAGRTSALRRIDGLQRVDYGPSFIRNADVRRNVCCPQTHSLRSASSRRSASSARIAGSGRSA